MVGIQARGFAGAEVVEFLGCGVGHARGASILKSRAILKKNPNNNPKNQFFFFFYKIHDPIEKTSWGAGETIIFFFSGAPI